MNKCTDRETKDYLSILHTMHADQFDHLYNEFSSTYEAVSWFHSPLFSAFLLTLSSFSIVLRSPIGSSLFLNTLISTISPPTLLSVFSIVFQSPPLSLVTNSKFLLLPASLSPLSSWSVSVPYHLSINLNLLFMVTQMMMIKIAQMRLFFLLMTRCSILSSGSWRRSVGSSTVSLFYSFLFIYLSYICPLFY